MKDRIKVAYTGIGYGRPGCAYSLRSWGGENVVLYDVFNQPHTNRLKVTTYRAGYHTLSKLPHSIYERVRKNVDRNKDNGIVNPERIRADFEKADVAIAVSPVASAILSSAGVGHWNVNVDHFLPEEHITPHVKRLFVPEKELVDGKNIPPHCTVTHVGGVLWPREYQGIDFGKRRKHLTHDGVPTIGIVSHGAGEFGSVFTLAYLDRLLKEKRIHAAFFTGGHLWMSVLLRRIAAGRNIPEVGSLDDSQRAGAISIWDGQSTEIALDVRTRLLTSNDYHLSVLPTGNENCDNGPALVGGARSPIERNTFENAYRGGWADHRGNPHDISTRLMEVLDARNGSSRAQQMTDRAAEHLVFDAGAKVMEAVRRG